MITSLRRGNLLLAFLLELGMLVAFCYAGWAATGARRLCAALSQCVTSY